MYSDLSQLLAEQGQTVQPQGYTMADGTLVKPAMAVDPTAAGQAYGGAGMAMPKGSTSINGGNGMGYASILSGLMSNLASSAQQYSQGAAMKAYQPTQSQESGYQPVLAQMPLQPLGGGQQVIRG